MDSPNSGATPIGWTELLAGTVAMLFALLSTWGLVAVLVGRPRLVDAAGLSSGAPPGSVEVPTSCSKGPGLGGMRLGAERVYGGSGVSLEPVPMAITPAVSAEDAYRTAAPTPRGCQSEEVLAYYSDGSPGFQRVLAWTVVQAFPCGSRRCLMVSPVDARTGQALPPTSFAVDPVK